MLQGEAIEELHGDEGLLAVAADFINGADVGMVESGGGAGFTAETLEGLRVAGKLVGQEFESDEAAEFSVLGFVDHAHAAAAELFHDAVVGDGLVDHVESVAAGSGVCPGRFILRRSWMAVNLGMRFCCCWQADRSVRPTWSNSTVRRRLCRALCCKRRRR